MLTDLDLWERRQEHLLDNEPDYALVCEWCDELVEQSAIDDEQCATMGGVCCATCYAKWGP